MSDGSVSSSSGEPFFESPDNSDADDDDDSDNNNIDGTESSHGSPSKPHGSHKKKTAAIDPFKFQARSFQKVNTAITSAQQHPSPSREKKRTRTDDTGGELERSLEELKRKSQAHLMASQQKLRKRKMVNENENNDSDDSDGDSDGDVLEGRAGVKDANKQSKEKSRNGEGSVSKQQDLQEQNVIELLSDDDKEPADVEKMPSANATVRRSPRIARSAASAAVAVALLSATSKITPPAYDNSTDDDSVKEMSAGAVARSLTRRNNNPLPAGAAEAMMRARMAQSKLTQAQHYHAHDLYVPVKEPELIQRRPSSAPSSARKPLSGIKAAALNLGIPLKVVCRTQLYITTEKNKRTQDVKLSIRDKEPLQELYNRLFQELALPPTATLTMSFDGMNIEKSKTPKSYDMEDGDLIDCTAQATYLLTTKRESTPVIPTSLNVKKIPLGKRLKLNCRAQVKLSGTQQQKKAHHLLSSNLELREHEPLSILLDSMVKAHNIPTTAKVKMLFDGEVCNLEKTPTNYGMEADDMIDFTVEVDSFWL
ncbi:ubiquitin-2/rad60 SUMO-like protein [Nitzschia inconspicua]|uniref:Ubiquitin-2/rad60 SUMO-like protein n=1 Tax=Nitzschia inconspicua TaxID=303405 RepID=A0A9K3M0W4_9STRA|nr:ubiquitin-2/rad60 SUMO-like protein [Nitzschia inconspicua]